MNTFTKIVIQLLFHLVLKVGLYVMKWNVTYVCVEPLLHS